MDSGFRILQTFLIWGHIKYEDNCKLVYFTLLLWGETLKFKNIAF